MIILMTRMNQKINMVLERGVAEVIDRKHLIQSLKSGRKLRVKLGIDPTVKDIHLGHTVPLVKLNQFQNLGHQAVLIVGDFTALIGDPSERAIGRPVSTPKEIKENLKTYKKQVAKILDLKKTEIHFNSEWFSKKKFDFFLELGRRFTLSQLIEREDIQKRRKKGQAVSIIEIMYPLLQGYDSVMVKADIELGGIDQKLNLLFGREMQRNYKQKPQDILMVPYLIGLDGRNKMSKTYGNTVNLEDRPNNIFGKLMSISDKLLIHYFGLLTNQSITTTTGSKAKELKLNLAFEVVKKLYSQKDALRAQEDFIKTFFKKEGAIAHSVKIRKGKWRLDRLLFEIDATDSKSKAQRLIRQGAIDINGKQRFSWSEKINILKPISLRVGKYKFYKIKPE